MRMGSHANTQNPVFYLVIQTFWERYYIYLLPVLAFAETGKLSLGGATLAVEWATLIIFIPYGGRLVDRFNNAQLYIFSNFYRGVVLGGSSVWIVLGRADFAIFVLGMLLGPANTITYLGFERFASSLSAVEGARAYSLFQTIQYVCLAISPIFGAIALTHLKPEYVVALGSVGYLLLMFSKGIPSNGETFTRNKHGKIPIVEVLKAPEMRGIAALLFATNLAISALGVSLPALSGGSSSGVAVVSAIAAAISMSYSCILYKRIRNNPTLVLFGKKLGFYCCCLMGLGVLLKEFLIIKLLCFALALGLMVAFGVWIRQLRNSVLGENRASATWVSSFMVISYLAPVFSGSFLSISDGWLNNEVSIGIIVVISITLYLLGSRLIKGIEVSDV